MSPSRINVTPSNLWGASPSVGVQNSTELVEKLNATFAKIRSEYEGEEVPDITVSAQNTDVVTADQTNKRMRLLVQVNGETLDFIDVAFGERTRQGPSLLYGDIKPNSFNVFGTISPIVTKKTDKDPSGKRTTYFDATNVRSPIETAATYIVAGIKRSRQAGSDNRSIRAGMQEVFFTGSEEFRLPKSGVTLYPGIRQGGRLAAANTINFYPEGIETIKDRELLETAVNEFTRNPKTIFYGYSFKTKGDSQNALELNFPELPTNAPGFGISYTGNAAKIGKSNRIDKGTSETASTFIDSRGRILQSHQDNISGVVRARGTLPGEKGKRVGIRKRVLIATRPDMPGAAMVSPDFFRTKVVQKDKTVRSIGFSPTVAGENLTRIGFNNIEDFANSLLSEDPAKKLMITRISETPYPAYEHPIGATYGSQNITYPTSHYKKLYSKQTLHIPTYYNFRTNKFTNLPGPDTVESRNYRIEDGLTLEQYFQQNADRYGLANIEFSTNSSENDVYLTAQTRSIVKGSIKFRGIKAGVSYAGRQISFEGRDVDFVTGEVKSGSGTMLNIWEALSTRKRKNLLRLTGMSPKLKKGESRLAFAQELSNTIYQLAQSQGKDFTDTLYERTGIQINAQDEWISDATYSESQKKYYEDMVSQQDESVQNTIRQNVRFIPAENQPGFYAMHYKVPAFRGMAADILTEFSPEYPFKQVNFNAKMLHSLRRGSPEIFKVMQQQTSGIPNRGTPDKSVYQTRTSKEAWTGLTAWHQWQTEALGLNDINSETTTPMLKRGVNIGVANTGLTYEIQRALAEAQTVLQESGSDEKSIQKLHQRFLEIQEKFPEAGNLLEGWLYSPEKGISAPSLLDVASVESIHESGVENEGVSASKLYRQWLRYTQTLMDTGENVVSDEQRAFYQKIGKSLMDPTGNVTKGTSQNLTSQILPGIGGRYSAASALNANEVAASNSRIKQMLSKSGKSKEEIAEIMDWLDTDENAYLPVIVSRYPDVSGSRAVVPAKMISTKRLRQRGYKLDRGEQPEMPMYISPMLNDMFVGDWDDDPGVAALIPIAKGEGTQKFRIVDPKADKEFEEQTEIGGEIYSATGVMRTLQGQFGRHAKSLYSSFKQILDYAESIDPQGNAPTPMTKVKNPVVGIAEANEQIAKMRKRAMGMATSYNARTLFFDIAQAVSGKQNKDDLDLLDTAYEKMSYNYQSYLDALPSSLGDFSQLERMMSTSNLRWQPENTYGVIGQVDETKPSGKLTMTYLESVRGSSYEGKNWINTNTPVTTLTDGRNSVTNNRNWINNMVYNLADSDQDSLPDEAFSWVAARRGMGALLFETLKEKRAQDPTKTRTAIINEMLHTEDGKAFFGYDSPGYLMVASTAVRQNQTKKKNRAPASAQIMWLNEKGEAVPTAISDVLQSPIYQQINALRSTLMHRGGVPTVKQMRLLKENLPNMQGTRIEETISDFVSSMESRYDLSGQPSDIQRSQMRKLVKSLNTIRMSGSIIPIDILNFGEFGQENIELLSKELGLGTNIKSLSAGSKNYPWQVMAKTMGQGWLGGSGSIYGADEESQVLNSRIPRSKGTGYVETLGELFHEGHIFEENLTNENDRMGFIRSYHVGDKSFNFTIEGGKLGGPSIQMTGTPDFIGISDRNGERQLRIVDAKFSNHPRNIQYGMQVMSYAYGLGKLAKENRGALEVTLKNFGVAEADIPEMVELAAQNKFDLGIVSPTDHELGALTKSTQTWNIGWNDKIKENYERQMRILARKMKNEIPSMVVSTFDFLTGAPVEKPEHQAFFSKASFKRMPNAVDQTMLSLLAKQFRNQPDGYAGGTSDGVSEVFRVGEGGPELIAKRKDGSFAVIPTSVVSALEKGMPHTDPRFKGFAGGSGFHLSDWSDLPENIKQILMGKKIKIGDQSFDIDQDVWQELAADEKLKYLPSAAEVAQSSVFQGAVAPTPQQVTQLATTFGGTQDIMNAFLGGDTSTPVTEIQGGRPRRSAMLQPLIAKVGASIGLRGGVERYAAETAQKIRAIAVESGVEGISEDMPITDVFAATIAYDPDAQEYKYPGAARKVRALAQREKKNLPIVSRFMSTVREASRVDPGAIQSETVREEDLNDLLETYGVSATPNEKATNAGAVMALQQFGKLDPIPYGETTVTPEAMKRTADAMAALNKSIVDLGKGAEHATKAMANLPGQIEEARQALGASGLQELQGIFQQLGIAPDSTNEQAAEAIYRLEQEKVFTSQEGTQLVNKIARFSRAVEEGEIADPSGGGLSKAVGGFARSALSGFGLMYLKSIGGLMMSGAYKGYGQYEQLERQAQAGVAGMGFMPTLTAAEFNERAKALQYAGIGGQAVQEISGLATMTAPATMGGVGTFGSNVAAFGAASWVQKLLMSNVAKDLGGKSSFVNWLSGNVGEKSGVSSFFAKTMPAVAATAAITQLASAGIQYAGSAMNPEDVAVALETRGAGKIWGDIAGGMAASGLSLGTTFALSGAGWPGAIAGGILGAGTSLLSNAGYAFPSEEAKQYRSIINQASYAFSGTGPQINTKRSIYTSYDTAANPQAYNSAMAALQQAEYSGVNIQDLSKRWQSLRETDPQRAAKEISAFIKSEAGTTYDPGLMASTVQKMMYYNLDSGTLPNIMNDTIAMGAAGFDPYALAKRQIAVETGGFSGTDIASGDFAKVLKEVFEMASDPAALETFNGLTALLSQAGATGTAVSAWIEKNAVEPSALGVAAAGTASGGMTKDQLANQMLKDPSMFLKATADIARNINAPEYAQYKNYLTAGFASTAASERALTPIETATKLAEYGLQTNISTVGGATYASKAYSAARSFEQLLLGRGVEQEAAEKGFEKFGNIIANNPEALRLYENIMSGNPIQIADALMKDGGLNAILPGYSGSTIKGWEAALTGVQNPSSVNVAGYQLNGLNFGARSFASPGRTALQNAINIWGGTSKSNISSLEDFKAFATDTYGKYGGGMIVAGIDGYKSVNGTTYFGEAGMARYQNDQSLQLSLAGAGLQARSNALQYAFTTGIGLQNYTTVNPVTNQTFSLRPGGFWGIEDTQRQMGYQQQMWGFSQQQKQLQMNNDFFWRETNINRTQQLWQRGWTQEDWGYQSQMRNMQWGWRQEDFAEQARFMTGRDRRLAERSMKRETTAFNLEGDQIEKQKNRQRELWELEDQRYNLQITQHNQVLKFQEEQLAKDIEFYAQRFQLEGESMELQRAFWVEQQKIAKASAGISAAAAIAQHEMNEAQLDYKDYLEETHGKLNLLNDYSMIRFLGHLRTFKDLINDFDWGNLGVTEDTDQRPEGLGGGGGGGDLNPHPVATSPSVLPTTTGTSLTALTTSSVAQPIVNPWSQPEITKTISSSLSKTGTSITINIGNKMFKAYIVDTIEETINL